MAQVDRAPVAVGEPAVVEDLEEDVPDLRVRLLELVEQQDENGCLRTWAISGPLSSACRVAEKAVEALRRLVLAHVEPDEPVLRAEQELAEGLRDLGLAGAGRADEEEDAERARRVGEPRLHERDPVDEALDRLWLAEHASLEEGARPARGSAAAVGSSTWSGSPVASLSVAITVSGSIAVATPRAMRSRTSSSTRRTFPGDGRRRQIVGGEVERLRQRLVVDVELVVGAQSRAISIASAPVAGASLTTSNSRAIRGPVLQHELVGAGVDLADDDGVPGLDMGEECVQHAARALHVLAATRAPPRSSGRPRRSAAGRGGRRSPAPALRASRRTPGPRSRRPRRPGTRTGRRRAAGAPRRSASSCRRPARRRAGPSGAATRRGRRRARRRPRSGCRRALPEAGRPDRRARAERAEEVDVDRRRLPLLERGPERGPGRDVGSVDQLADERLQAGIELVELARASGAPPLRRAPRGSVRPPARAGCRTSPPPQSRAPAESRCRRFPRARGAAAAVLPIRRARSGFPRSPSSRAAQNGRRRSRPWRRRGETSHRGARRPRTYRRRCSPDR